MTGQSLYLGVLLGMAAGGCLQAADRPDLNGNWQFDAAHSEMHSQIPPGLVWQIEQTGDSIHVVEHAGDKSVNDFTCATDGKECKVKSYGHPAKASFYYNGPVLVEVETMGQNRDTVIKKRMELSGDGSVLTVEVMHIMPSGKGPEKLVMTRKAGVPMAGLTSSPAK